MPRPVADGVPDANRREGSAACRGERRPYELDRVQAIRLRPTRMDGDQAGRGGRIRDQQDRPWLAVLATVSRSSTRAPAWIISRTLGGGRCAASGPDMDRSPQGGGAGDPALGLRFAGSTALRLAQPRARPAGNAAWAAFPLRRLKGKPVGRIRGAPWFLAYVRDHRPTRCWPRSGSAAAMCLASAAAGRGDYYLRRGVRVCDRPGEAAFHRHDAPARSRQRSMAAAPAATGAAYLVSGQIRAGARKSSSGGYAPGRPVRVLVRGTPHYHLMVRQNFLRPGAGRTCRRKLCSGVGNTGRIRRSRRARAVEAPDLSAISPAQGRLLRIPDREDPPRPSRDHHTVRAKAGRGWPGWRRRESRRR